MARAIVVSGAFCPLWILLSILLAIAIFSCSYGHDSAGVPEDVAIFIEHLRPKVIKGHVQHAFQHLSNSTTHLMATQYNHTMNSTYGRVGQTVAQYAAHGGAITASWCQLAVQFVLRFIARKLQEIYFELAPQPLTWLLQRLYVASGKGLNAVAEWWPGAKANLQDQVHNRILSHLTVDDEVAASIAMALSLLVGTFFSLCIVLVPARHLIKKGTLEELKIFEEKFQQRIHVKYITFSLRRSELQLYNVQVANPRHFTHMAGYLLKIDRVRVHLRPLPLIFGFITSSRFLVENSTLQYKPGLKLGTPSNVAMALERLKEIKTAAQASSTSSHPTPEKAASQKKAAKAAAATAATEQQNKAPLPSRSFNILVPFVFEESKSHGSTEILCSVLEQTMEECIATFQNQKLTSYEEVKQLRQLEATEATEDELEAFESRSCGCLLM